MPGHVTPGQLDRQHRQAAAQGDHRSLRPDHRTQPQAGQRRQENAGQLDRSRHAARLEAIGRRVASPPGQVLNHGPNQHPRHCQGQQRPPGWLAVKSQPFGQIGEYPRLQVGDQLEEPVDQEGDRDPQDRGHDQQHRVLPGPQDSERISWCAHRDLPTLRGGDLPGLAIDFASQATAAHHPARVIRAARLRDGHGPQAHRRPQYV